MMSCGERFFYQAQALIRLWKRPVVQRMPLIVVELMKIVAASLACRVDLRLLGSTSYKRCFNQKVFTDN